VVRREIPHMFNNKGGIDDLADIVYMLAFIFVVVIVTAMILYQIADVAAIPEYNVYANVIETVGTQFSNVIAMIGIAIIVIVALKAILGGFFAGFVKGNN
jgi:hypothetical protein